MTGHPEFIYGTAWKEDRTAALTELAVRSGFRAVDTANQRRHYFEAQVGEALAKLYAAGVAAREQLFLQTKFTYRGGQDHRLPYDPEASLTTQVEQSLASSLDHLGTNYVDSYLLHGPASGYEWTAADREVWDAILAHKAAGRVRVAGLSNVSIRHLMQMASGGLELPAIVQNRCYAQLGWDRDVRWFCRENGIVYQGFSLLTANAGMLRHPLVERMARRNGVTSAQVIFAFARAIGIVPLTGTTNREHMAQDLASVGLDLADDLRREGLSDAEQMATVLTPKA